jgi:hypothetical protein
VTVSSPLAKNDLARRHKTDLFNLSVKGVEIHKQIDARIGKSRHAALVVGCRINMVDPDGIGPQLGHQGDVALALGRVDQRVMRGELICQAWAPLAVVAQPLLAQGSGTFQIVLRAVLIEELGSDGRDGRDSAHSHRPQRPEQERQRGCREGG